MGRITSYVLITSTLEEEPDDCWPAIDQLNRLIEESGERPGFIKIGHHSGGTKAPTMLVFGFIANYFDIDRMKEILLQVEWKTPDKVRLIYYGHFVDEAANMLKLSECTLLVTSEMINAGVSIIRENSGGSNIRFSDRVLVKNVYEAMRMYDPFFEQNT